MKTSTPMRVGVMLSSSCSARGSTPPRRCGPLGRGNTLLRRCRQEVILPPFTPGVDAPYGERRSDRMVADHGAPIPPPALGEWSRPRMHSDVRFPASWGYLPKAPKRYISRDTYLLTI